MKADTYEYKPIDIPIEEMSYNQYLELTLAWLEDTNDGELLDLVSPLECPIHKWIKETNRICSGDTIPNTAKCPVCGYYECPDCHSHKVDVLSRVTGYLQVVSGWNSAKTQEFEDRTRYDVS
jgi:hypothetical protein